MRLQLVPAPLEDPKASSEETAAAGVLSIDANGTPLTEGVSCDSNSLQPGPLVSAYPLAEWLVWNWWRLRWEPTPSRVTRNWAFAHRLSSVGSGYCWPNLEVASDGVRVRLISTPSVDPRSSTFRYVGAPRSEAVTAATFESAVDAFVEEVLERLGEHGASVSNLSVLAHNLKKDRSDGEQSSFRRLEAMLGSDVDEGDAAAIRRRLSDTRSLGEHAVLELAADPEPVGSAELRKSLDLAGFEFRSGDGVTLNPDDSVAEWGTTDAWRIGVAFARLLRDQELRNGDSVTNRRLAEMSGAQERVLSDSDITSECLSFEWEMGDRGQMALRSNWVTGRRFDLARLLAERLLSPDGTEPLRAVTRSYTYRQKAQRAFAAEFLAPVEVVDAFLRGDYSEDRQSDAAEHFQVSAYTVRSLLVHNNRLGRRGALDALDRM